MLLGDILRTLAYQVPGLIEFETLVDTPSSASLRVHVGDNWYVLSLARDAADNESASPS